MPGLWSEARERVAVAEQGAVLETVRGGSRGSLRERLCAASGATFRAGGEHRAGHRSSLFGALGGSETEARAAADGGGPDLPGKEAEVCDGGEQSEESRAVMVRRREEKETLDEFFRTQLSRKQRHGIEAACLDMWEPYRLSLAQWTPACRLVYDKFHLLQHANAALDQVRRTEAFRQVGR